MTTQEEKRKPNHLIHSTSPYLLQHAHNPVDWYPWSEEALKRAKEEDKPIFLSIGYSTCHWCHVMEEESFEDEAVAAILNEHFISIKVDREERPDLDGIYMKAVVAMTGQGGWPLNVFLTSDGKPFYGGTYFPPDDRYGRTGLKRLLMGVAQAWKEKREDLTKSSDQLAQAVQSFYISKEEAPIGMDAIKKAAEDFRSQYDRTFGGFGQAPKFPQATNLSFLLRYWKRTGDEAMLEMVENTLENLRLGGIHDHLGGGFHRYSTDQRWLVPHFEKMLYDQALLARAYLEAYQATGKERDARTARDIFSYVLRDMRQPKGGFSSAEDADTEGEEGKFYVWTYEEIEKELGKEVGRLFSQVYGISREGNFEGGRSILSLREELEEFAKREGRNPEELKETLSRARQKLFEARKRRVAPFKDDKVVTSWNGLMLSAFCLGYQVLREPQYLDAANSCANFILESLTENGRLLRSYREGEASTPAYLEDYAFFIMGLLDLYETTFDERWIKEAIRLAEDMVALFWDKEHGGFFSTASDAEVLFAREKEAYDGALPSGNSVAALDLVRLGRMTTEKKWEKLAQEAMETFSGQMSKYPMGFTQLLMALDFALGPSYEIVVAGKTEAPLTQNMLNLIHGLFLPNKIVALHPPAPQGKGIEGFMPFLKDLQPIEGKTTAYICENYSCQLPTSDPIKVRELLRAQK